MSMRLPTDAKERKGIPLASGVLDYFPDALVEVAVLSKIGNDQHNPGQPLHWNKSKSTDHAECILRHMIDRGTVDSDGVRHSTKVAWRALAQLQIEIETERKAQADAQFKAKIIEVDTPKTFTPSEYPAYPWLQTGADATTTVVTNTPRPTDVLYEEGGAWIPLDEYVRPIGEWVALKYSDGRIWDTKARVWR